jgi:hypothetical protein
MRNPQSDPMKEVQLERERLELEQLRNPPVKPPSPYSELGKLKADFDAGLMSEKAYNDAGERANTPKGPLVQNNIGGEPGDGELRKSLDKAEGDLWSGYKKAASVSGSNAQDFAVLDELMNIAPQGPLTGRLAEAFPGFSSAGDAFQSIVKRIAPTMRAEGSGSTSDIEYDGMLRSLPALRNAPDGNRMILSIMRAKADINVKRGEVVTAYSTGEIDAATARRQIAELDRASIVTPEMRAALDGISGVPGTSTPNTPQGQQGAVDPSTAPPAAPTGNFDLDINSIPDGKRVEGDDGKFYMRRNGKLWVQTPSGWEEAK